MKRVNETRDDASSKKNYIIYEINKTGSISN